MLFKTQFQKFDSQLQELFEDYFKRANQLPIELQKLMESNQTRLLSFIENFQNEILAIKKSGERDCVLINKLQFENNQHKYQSELIDSATRMEQQIVQKLRINLKLAEDVNQCLDSKIEKQQENLNRNEIDLDQCVKNNRKKSDTLKGSTIQIDKQNNKLIIRFQKNGKKEFQISYNRGQDKFVPAYLISPSIGSIISEFNFHRDLNKLCAQIYQFS